LLAALMISLVFVFSELVRLLVELRPMARRLVPSPARADR
jgi:hypothetical protein